MVASLTLPAYSSGDQVERVACGLLVKYHARPRTSSLEVVLSCCRDQRFMPEPTRLAHNLVNEFAGPTARRFNPQSES
jgi:hypothetical protein